MQRPLATPWKLDVIEVTRLVHHPGKKTRRQLLGRFAVDARRYVAVLQFSDNDSDQGVERASRPQSADSVLVNATDDSASLQIQPLLLVVEQMNLQAGC